ncbi:MAG: AAA family ATPase [Clostridia bacterium]|nr:AAA family ATPase [Clostridia bacterium]
MCTYFNPGNKKFHNCVNDYIYVDKTGIIALTNSRLSKSDKYMCVTRPRRFGKSYVADMLTAYYSRGCDSGALFEGLDIAADRSYKEHLNKYNVIYFDVAQIIKTDVDAKTGIGKLSADIADQAEKQYPDIVFKKKDPISMFEEIFTETETGFIFIIDEWDCPFRERKNDSESQKLYLQFLKDMLKNREYVSLAYMTGILPIKKYATESSLNIFREYTMLDPGPVKQYIGFTKGEVETLCEKCGMSPKDLEAWYDGYNLDGLEIYNPNSVVIALKEKRLGNYWTDTDSFKDLLGYIKANVDGLHDVIVKLLEGEKYVLKSVTSFLNDLVNFRCKEDYLIALIHLGYLSYNSADGEVRIPNFEIRNKFMDSVDQMEPSVVQKHYEYSSKLLDATLSLSAGDVAMTLGRIFSELTLRTGYADEADFGNFVHSAYNFVAGDYYDIVPEAQTRWLKKADFVLYPNVLKARPDRFYLPGVIIELKNNKPTKDAAKQIVEKGYDDYFEYRGYHGDVIHVGLDFKKMPEKKRRALAKKKACSHGGNVAPGSFGNDAKLDTRAEVVHFCEIKKYTV